jgi:hypothetical protein
MAFESAHSITFEVSLKSGDSSQKKLDSPDDDSE